MNTSAEQYVVPANIMQSMLDVLGQLPHAQVDPLVQAIRTNVHPLVTETNDGDDKGE